MAVNSFGTTIAALACAGAAVALSVAAPAAHADEQWGSCAAPANPQAAANAYCVGATPYPAQATAESRALDMCNYLKDRGCWVVISFTDCGAIAQSGDQWAGGTGATEQDAAQAAESQLSGAAVRKSACVVRG